MERCQYIFPLFVLFCVWAIVGERAHSFAAHLARKESIACRNNIPLTSVSLNSLGRGYT